MKRALVAAIFFLLVTGCAGRAANPVMVSQVGDEERSCAALEKELAFIEGEIQRLIPESEKTGKNVALGVVGIFLIVPWFFMDLSQAEQVEINAFRQRYNHLVILADEKGCGLQKEEIPDPKETAKKAKEEKKKETESK